MAMHFNKIIFSLFLLLFAPFCLAQEQANLDEAACKVAFAALPRPTTLRAAFNQEKSLPDVTKPLRAQGEILVSGPHGVILRTLQPAFAQSTRVIPLPRPGQAAANLEARIGQTIQSVLAGDFAALADLFAAAGQRHGKELQITLTPKPPQVKEAISKISLRFHTYLEEIVVEEAGGSRVRLVFSGFRVAPPATAEEIQAFNAAR